MHSHTLNIHAQSLQSKCSPSAAQHDPEIRILRQKRAAKRYARTDGLHQTSRRVYTAFAEDRRRRYGR